MRNATKGDFSKLKLEGIAEEGVLLGMTVEVVIVGIAVGGRMKGWRRR